MDIIGLDTNFDVVCYVPYINLQWNRRYYEPGEFSAQLRVEDYDHDIQYLYAPHRPELAIVQRVDLTRELKGDFVQLSGRFFESVLERHYAYPYIQGDFTLKALGKHMLEHDLYRLDEFNITVSPNTPTSISTAVDWQNEQIGVCAYRTLEALEMSQRITYDPTTNALAWSTWQGLDRTQEQNANEYAMFADDSYHVSNFEYARDESGYRNHAIVFYGSDSDGNPYRYDYYAPECETMGKRCILMNVDDDLSPSQMEAKAKEELEQYPIVHEAMVTVIQDGLVYLQDYDIGDKVDVVCHLLQKSFSARITGINEVFKGGQHQVELLIGKCTKTTYQRVTRFARSALLAKPVTKIS